MNIYGLLFIEKSVIINVYKLERVSTKQRRKPTKIVWQSSLLTIRENLDLNWKNYPGLYYIIKIGNRKPGIQIEFLDSDISEENLFIFNDR